MNDESLSQLTDSLMKTIHEEGCSFDPMQLKEMLRKEFQSQKTPNEGRVILKVLWRVVACQSRHALLKHNQGYNNPMKAIRFIERWLDSWANYPSHAVVLIVLSTILALLAIYFSIYAIS